MKVYKITLTTPDRTREHISYYRGKTWETVLYSYDLVKEKTKKEKRDWAVYDIKRLR